MTEKSTMSNMASDNVFSFIRDGMPVFDADDRKIGRVKSVNFGDRYDVAPVARPVEFYDLPAEIQNRLARDGFVLIDCGIFSHDCLVTSDQIEDVNEDEIRLIVLRENLVTV